jgi:hypothetical protein
MEENGEWLNRVHIWMKSWIFSARHWNRAAKLNVQAHSFPRIVVCQNKNSENVDLFLWLRSDGTPNLSIWSDCQPELISQNFGMSDIWVRRMQPEFLLGKASMTKIPHTQRFLWRSYGEIIGLLLVQIAYLSDIASWGLFFLSFMDNHFKGSCFWTVKEMQKVRQLAKERILKVIWKL